ncbi:MAG: hypothetical protein K9J31_07400 [Saprospiraceae bacterium]|nr:hypothetical protein [Saprospiraceae bacterium]
MRFKKTQTEDTACGFQVMKNGLKKKLIVFDGLGFVSIGAAKVRVETLSGNRMIWLKFIAKAAFYRINR